MQLLPFVFKVPLPLGFPKMLIAAEDFGILKVRTKRTGTSLDVQLLKVAQSAGVHLLNP